MTKKAKPDTLLSPPIQEAIMNTEQRTNQFFKEKHDSEKRWLGGALLVSFVLALMLLCIACQSPETVVVEDTDDRVGSLLLTVPEGGGG